MRSLARTFSGFALANFLSLGLFSCGGGGGGGGGPNAVISGTITVPSGGGPIIEAEPNDSLAQAQNLGTLYAGQTINVTGDLTDPTDLQDFFTLVAPSRVKITATLTFDDSTGNQFDLGIIDPFAADVVEAFFGFTSPATGSFHAQGTFLPLVQQFAGSGNYTLTFEAVAPTDPIVEREPNDITTQGQYLGAIDAGQQVRLSGNANSGPDPDDRFLLAVPADIDLAASLAFPGGADFDVIYSDATDLILPVELVRFESPTNNPETGSFTIPALTLLEVNVFAFSGSGAYTLTLNATPADDFAASARVWRLASTTHELRRRFAPRANSRFGSPVFESMPGELLVLPRDGADISLELARRGLRVDARIPGGAMKCVESVPEGVSEEASRRRTLAQVASLSNCAAVAYAEPNFICHAYSQTPNDPFFNLQWHYAQIQLPAAWDITLGDNAIRMGVIDTGETLHPDLAARLIQGFDFISSAAIAGDGGGVDTDPTDVGDGQGAQPSSFHGTHVAGTMGASTDNGIGVAGVTWLGQIMHLRVLGIGGGTVFDISNAVLHSAGLASTAQPLAPVLATPLDVINMSLGGPGFSQIFQDACTDAHNAGVTIFAAAGNENSTVPSYPAAFDDVISVAAVDFNAARAPYSNRHDTVDLAAPGGDTSKDLNGDGFPDGVLSTLADDSGNPTVFTFAFYQGTSMASPHAAGVAALVIAASPGPLTPAEVETIMTSNATDLGAAGHDTSFGWGLVNAFQAVLDASNGAPVNPVLGLSTQSLSFAPNTSSLNVQVSNLGGGTLLVSNPIVSTDIGGNWLAAVRVPIAAPVSSDTSSIAVSVDRSALADGLYTGSVTVPSNGTNGSLVIQVAMQVDASATPEDVDIYVIAVDALTGNSVRQDIVNPTGSLAYAVGALPAGSYLIFAGSDDDGDLFIGGSGDRFFGAFPTLDQPVAVDVLDGQAVPTIDFAVQEGFQDGPASAPKRRMRPAGE